VKRLLLGAVVTIAALSACGGAGDAEPTTVTITKPAPAPVTVTDAQPVEVVTEVTPPSCLKALDAAEVVADDSAEFGQIVVDMTEALPDAITAAFNHDVAGIEAATAAQQRINTRLDNLVDQVKPHVAEFNSQADDCRASAP